VLVSNYTLGKKDDDLESSELKDSITLAVNLKKNKN
jgi:hypothetical protein